MTAIDPITSEVRWTIDDGMNTFEIIARISLSELERPFLLLINFEMKIKTKRDF